MMPGEHASATPVVFIEAALERFERAARSLTLREHCLRIAETCVRLRFAGVRMEELLFPAIAHLESTPALPDLTVSFFDSESSGVDMAPPPWSLDAYTPTGEILGYGDGQVHFNYTPGVDILNCLDAPRGLGIYWTPSWKLIPYWERSFPLRAILNWWLKNRPLQPIHAGAVGYPEGGLLIVGASGSGKSTTTLACLESDLYFAGDDYVLVRTQPDPYVYSLYNTAKVEPEDLARFPRLTPHVDNPNALATEKALVFLTRSHPSRLIRGFPIRAILCPRVSGKRDTECQAAAPRDAFLAIAPTTTMHLPGTRRQTVEKLLQLARSLPCFILEAGTELPQIPNVLARLLKELR